MNWWEKKKHPWQILVTLQKIRLWPGILFPNYGHLAVSDLVCESFDLQDYMCHGQNMVYGLLSSISYWVSWINAYIKPCANGLMAIPQCGCIIQLVIMVGCISYDMPILFPLYHYIPIVSPCFSHDIPSMSHEFPLKSLLFIVKLQPNSIMFHECSMNLPLCSKTIQIPTFHGKTSQLQRALLGAPNAPSPAATSSSVRRG